MKQGTDRVTDEGAFRIMRQWQKERDNTVKKRNGNIDDAFYLVHDKRDRVKEAASVMFGEEFLSDYRTGANIQIDKAKRKKIKNETYRLLDNRGYCYFSGQWWGVTGHFNPAELSTNLETLTFSRLVDNAGFAYQSKLIDGINILYREGLSWNDDMGRYEKLNMVNQETVKKHGGIPRFKYTKTTKISKPKKPRRYSYQTEDAVGNITIYEGDL